MPPEKPTFKWSLPGELPAAVVAGVLLLSGYAVKAAWGWPGEVLAWLGLGIGLAYGGRAAWDAVRERKFDIDVLMVLAAVLAAVMGHAADGGLLLFLFNLSGALEDRAMQKTMRAVEALHKLMPSEAMVLREGKWVACVPGTLVAGDRIKVRPGELVAADAKVAEGVSSVDQATLTGESMPREIGVGDEIYAGTLNVDNPIEAVVTRAASESSLQKILHLVTSAQQQREPMQRVIDRMSGPYAMGVVAVSTLVFLVWWGVLGVKASGAAYTAIALLIVASPCALVIATPTATLAAISRAARAGLLFKGGQAIERLAHMRAVCMDKTGTLTLGKARLQQVHAVAWSDGGKLLAVAAGLEAGSTHPIARAIVEAAKARGVEAEAVVEPVDLPGKGLAGVVGGMPARLGTFAHCEELIPICLRARTREVLERIRSRGQIGVVVAWQAVGAPGEDGQAAVLVLSDSIRPGAAQMVRRFHEQGVRPVRMLTGDNRLTAEHVAAELGLDQWDAELLPQDKVRILGELKASLHTKGGGGVGVIGDGANDAPALAAADVAIGIGSIGSDAALESSDIVLLHEDLLVIPWGVGLARRTRAVIRFNIGLALTVIGGMGAATLVGSRLGWNVPLPVAVMAHEGGTLLVVLNSLRLLLAQGVQTATAHASEKNPRMGGAAVAAPI